MSNWLSETNGPGWPDHDEHEERIQGLEAAIGLLAVGVTLVAGVGFWLYHKQTERVARVEGELRRS